MRISESFAFNVIYDWGVKPHRQTRSRSLPIENQTGGSQFSYSRREFIRQVDTE